jgi:hypothetical protein
VGAKSKGGTLRGFIIEDRAEARKMYRSRDEAKADSTIGYLSPMEFERQTGLA